MKPHQQARFDQRLCIDCGLPVVGYMACLRCRLKRNDRRAQKNFDRWVDQEERLEQKYNLVDSATAARMCGVSTRTIRTYISTGRLTVQRREMRKVWLRKEDVREIKG